MKPREKRFELRIPAEVEEPLRQEADAEERSLNGHILWILKTYLADRRMQQTYEASAAFARAIVSSPQEETNAKTTEAPTPQRRTPRSR